MIAQPCAQRLGISRFGSEGGEELPSLARFGAKLLERARLDDAASLHDRDPVRHELRLAEHMGRHDQRGAALALLAEVAAHVGGGDRVQASGGLVAEDPVRLVQRGPNQRDLLRHAARVGGQHGVSAVGQLEPLQQRGDSLLPHIGRDAVKEAKVIEVLRRGVAAIEPRLVRHHAEPRPDLVQLLRQAQAVERDGACVRTQDSAEAAQRRRFASTVLAEQHEDLGLLDGDVHAVDSAHVSKALAKALDQDHLGDAVRSFRTNPLERRKQ